MLAIINSIIIYNNLKLGIILMSSYGQMNKQICGTSIPWDATRQ